MRYIIIKNLKLSFFIMYICINNFFYSLYILNKKFKKIYLCYTWSFGHKTFLFEYIVRRHFRKKKLNTINITSIKRDNKYLPYLYKNYFNIVKSFNYSDDKYSRISYFTLKKFLVIFSFFFKTKIVTYEDIIKIADKNKHKKPFYSHEKKKIIRISPLYFMDLLSKKQLKYQLPNKVRNVLVNILAKKKMTIKNKKIYTFSFRQMVNYKYKKNISSKDDYYDILRSKYCKPENFLKSIEYLSSKKENFLIIENLSFRLQKKIKKKFNNIFFYDLNDKYYSEFSIFSYFVENVRIMQNTGGMALSSYMGKRVIVTDYFPFNNGNPGHGYSVIFPKIKIGNKILNVKQYLNTEYFYGKGFDNKNVIILPNSSKLIKSVILDTKKYRSKKINFPKDTTIRLRQPITYY